MSVARPLALTLAVALAVPVVAAAQTDLKKVHCLFIGDGKDPELAQSVDKDLASMAKLFAECLPKDRFAVSTVRGDKVNPPDILDALAKLPVGKADALFVYYSGHGASDTLGLFFALGYTGTGREKYKLYRNELLDKMRARGAGLTMLVTDCCSTRMAAARGLRDDDDLLESRTRKGGEVTENDILPHVRKLFLQSRGVVDITAATDAPSWGLPTKGGFFTNAFAKTLDKPNSTARSWAEFHAQVVAETQRIYEKADSRGGILPDEAKGQPKQTPKAYALPDGGAAIVNAKLPPPPPPGPKTFAVVTVRTTADKPIPIKVSWSTDPKTVKDETIPAKGERQIFIVVPKDQPAPTLTLTMADGSGSYEKEATLVTAAGDKPPAVVPGLVKVRVTP